MCTASSSGLYGNHVVYAIAERGPREYNKLYSSGESAWVMQADKSIRYIIRHLEKGRCARMVAEEMNVSQRHVQRPRAEYLKAEAARIQGRTGRPEGADSSNAEVRMAPEAHHRWPDGAHLTAKSLRRNGCSMGYARARRTLKPDGPVTPSPAKSRRRKWARYERLYSNAVRHTDWRVMRDPRMKGMNLITYLDGASRRVTGATLQ